MRRNQLKYGANRHNPQKVPTSLLAIVKMSTEISPASTIFSYLPHPNPSQPPIPSALPSSKPMVYCSDHSHCARKSGVNIHNATGNENLVPNPATFARTSSSDLPYSHVALHYPIASHRILCTQRKHQPHCAATSPSDSTHCQLPRATPHSDLRIFQSCRRERKERQRPHHRPHHPPIIISDIVVKVLPTDLTKGSKGIDRKKSDFRVHYTLTLSEKCCHTGGKNCS